MLIRRILFFIYLIFLSVSCIPQKTCPAFASQFLLDYEVQRKRYSLFENDTIPRTDIVVKKSKYGIIGERTPRKVYRTMRTLPMDQIWPKAIPDSLSVDSTAVPPAYVYTDSNMWDNHAKLKLYLNSIKLATHVADTALDPYGFGKKRAIVNEDQVQYERLYGKYLPLRMDDRADSDEENEDSIRSEIEQQLLDNFDEGASQGYRRDTTALRTALPEGEIENAKKRKRRKRKEKKNSVDDTADPNVNEGVIDESIDVWDDNEFDQQGSKKRKNRKKKRVKKKKKPKKDKPPRRKKRGEDPAPPIELGDEN